MYSGYCILSKLTISYFFFQEENGKTRYVLVIYVFGVTKYITRAYIEKKRKKIPISLSFIVQIL